MTENRVQNQRAAGDTSPAIEPPGKRKLEVRRETVKDLAPDAADAAKVKGGVPNQTKGLFDR
jgi:hypothetical protein